ncbi:helix-turn-helix domain-containing protein [Roseomonas alkaliterrae]|uniref:carph-isopro domain-containing protein n=1 Tax=Neoroseomonas alkaliterrae TaxID=1452450 RepID=UPI001BA8FAE5|nr:helix-turn-helix domain-containing protein [Neoroseomonas alkaliterrae]
MLDDIHISWIPLGMVLRELVSALGGQRVVAERLGVGVTAVSNWVVRDRVPAQHRLTLWQMALDAGLDWTPPGAEALRDKLRGASEAPEAA